MSARDWDQRYVDGDLPWDTGHPDPHLVAQWAELVPTPARVLEVGCGTGTNAIWLAERGCEVVGVDVSARAIQHAMTKTAAAGVRVALSVANFLTDDAMTLITRGDGSSHAFYLQSWAFVRWLRAAAGSDIAERFEQFELLARGSGAGAQAGQHHSHDAKAAGELFARTVGPDLRALEADFRTWLGAFGS